MTLRQAGPIIAILALALAGCGSSSTPAPAATPTAAPAASPAAASAGASQAASPAAAASLAAGSIAYRVVNLSGAPIDVYVRTSGTIKASLAASGVASGAVSATVRPPDPGSVVVLKAGATNATCVSSCGFLAESTTSFGEGNARTIVVRADGAAEYWESPKPASVGTTANALRPADAAKALLFVVAQAVSDGNFGLNLAFAGTAGCQKNVDASNLLIGGTNVPVYAIPTAGAGVTIHGTNDKSCATVAGGPFQADGKAGTRAYLFLSGTQAALKGLVVPIP